MEHFQNPLSKINIFLTTCTPESRLLLNFCKLLHSLKKKKKKKNNNTISLFAFTAAP